MSLLTGLQWWWDLDAAGATIVDQQSGLTLTKGGTVTVVTGGAPDGGNCISVGAGAGWYVNSSVARTIDTNSGFTINAWAYSTGSSSVGNWLVSHRQVSATTAHWQITVRRSESTDKATHWDAAGTVRTASAGLAATTSAWHMFSLVDEITSTKLYVDGALAATASTSLGTRYASAQPLAIGAASWDTADTTLRHQGRLFGVGVWGRAIDSTEMTALYNGGLGKRFSSLGLSPRRRMSAQKSIAGTF